MERTMPEVFDISSDDEDGWGERVDWLSAMLDTEKDDSDEVLVVGEVFGSSVCQRQSNESSGRDNSDDECLILDGDPDKPVEVAANDSGNGSDELQIVGEKGQIACRDYPHPRHLCARFPFSTNPHEKHCELCHCYVCDTLAPCIYWGTGLATSDHCHSTDKEDVWRTQRKWIKQGAMAYPAPKHPEPPSLHKHIPAIAIPQPVADASTLPHMLSNPNTVRTCTSASSFGAPDIISQRSHQRPLLNPGRNRLPHHGMSTTASWSPGSTSIMSNTIRREKNIGSGNLGPRFVSPQMNFKKVGSGGTLYTKSRPASGSYHNNNHARSYMMSQQLRKHHKPLTYNGSQNTRSQDFCVGINSELISYPSAPQLATGGSFMDSQSPSQPGACQSASQPTTGACQISSQPTLGASQISSQSTMGACQISSQPTMGVCQSASQPTMGGSLMNSQSYNMPQVYNQPLLQPSENQNTYLPENPAPNMINQNISVYELNWFNLCSAADDPQRSNVQKTLQPPPPDTQPLNIQPLSEPPSGTQLSDTQPQPQPLLESSPVPEYVPQCPVDTNLSSTEYDLDSWIQSLEHQSDFETGKITVGSELGFGLSAAELVDPSMLMFGFENS